MFVEVKLNSSSNSKKYHHLDLSSIRVDNYQLELLEDTYQSSQYDFLRKLINEIIDIFEENTEYFYYTQCEEVLMWPDFFRLFKDLHKIFKERKLLHRFKVIDNNTSFSFRDNFWRYEGVPLMLGHSVHYKDNTVDEILSNENIENYLSKKDFKKTFLSLNGRPKEHRESLVQFIVDNNLTEKFFYSFGTSFGNNQNHPLYKKLDDKFKDNIRGVGLILSGYELNSFCYICTENSIGWQNTTDDIQLDKLVNSNENLFTHLTEKITRGIGTLMPFMVLGQPYTLKILKSHGFKTFSTWWDESYDDKLYWVDSLDIIKKNILEISKWDLNFCKEVYNEMLPTLKHNFQRHLEIQKNIYNNFAPVKTISFKSNLENTVREVLKNKQ